MAEHPDTPRVDGGQPTLSRSSGGGRTRRPRPLVAAGRQPSWARSELASGVAGVVPAAQAAPAPPLAVPADAAAPTGPAPTGRRRFSVADLTPGASATPLLILFGLNLVDEFDRIAFAALTPEIRDAFELQDSQIVAIGAVSAVFILLAALPIGYFADRLPRVKVASGAALIWGTMAVLTGVAPVVALLFVARLLSGVARTSNEVVHPSLLADYYEPSIQPRVFQIHRIASPLSAVAGLLAGGIGALLGWRPAFFLLAIPTFVLLAGLRRLREPHRGESVDSGLAAQVAATAAHVPFRVARRQLFGVRSLRRIWLGGFFLGIAFISIGQLLSLYFENVYGFGPWGRGLVQFLEGAGLVTGIVLGGNIASRATARGDFPMLARVTGGAFVWFAGGMVLMVASPWAPVSALLVFVFGMGLGAYQPAYYPLVARVVPARVRSQAYAWALLFVGVGGILSIPLASLGDRQGYRLALAILAVIVALGGLVVFSARRTVAEDVAAADASLAAAAAQAH